MSLLHRVLALISVLAGGTACSQACRAAEMPVNVIFDTDMGGDCDDVGALFILHGAVERGEAKLLATMGCVSADAIAPALDGINRRFPGRSRNRVATVTDRPAHWHGPLRPRTRAARCSETEAPEAE